METGQKTFQTNSKIDNILNTKLSIQVSLNGLSFCILDTKTNAITHYHSITFDKTLTPNDVLYQLKNQLSSNKVLQQDFNKVHLIHDNELSTLVPKALFNKDHLADYLKFNAKILSNDYITHDALNQGEIVNVYVPYININNYLYDAYGSFEYNHFSTLLLNALFLIKKENDELTMYVNVNKNHFEIVVFKNNNLILYNTFVYQTKEDFIYYILFTAEQLELNPEKFPLVLIGNITKEDALFHIAYTYVRQVTILENKLNFSLEIENTKAFEKNFILQHSF